MTDIPLDEADLDRLARALFKEEERMLPNGETWEGLDQGAMAHYYNCALAVVRELEKLLEARSALESK